MTCASRRSRFAAVFLARHMLAGVLALTTAALAPPGTVQAATKEYSHELPAGPVAPLRLEHAEFLPVEQGSLAGYLTIWNGTSADRVIRSVSVEGLGEARLARRIDGEIRRLPMESAVIAVPSNSELQMDPNTIFVILGNVTSFDSRNVVVRFDDDSSISTVARLVAEADTLTDHHHPSETKGQKP